MLGKLGMLWDLFRKGQEVADPEKWKAHQITGTMVAGFLLVAYRFISPFLSKHGIDIPISDEDFKAFGAAIVIVGNIVLTCITSKKAGLLPAKEPVQLPSGGGPNKDKEDATYIG